MKFLEHVDLLHPECLNDAGELRCDCGASGASAAVADSANHDKVAQFSFSDVVCRINLWVCGGLGQGRLYPDWLLCLAFDYFLFGKVVGFQNAMQSGKGKCCWHFRPIILLPMVVCVRNGACFHFFMLLYNWKCCL